VLAGLSLTAQALAAPPNSQPTAQSITQCLTVRHQASTITAISMADVEACATGAREISSGANVHTPGVYFARTSEGIDLLLIEGPTVSIPSSSPGDPCNYEQYTNWDSGGGAETLGAWMCYNGSVAWVSGSVNATCTAWFLGPAGIPMNCLYHNAGVLGNYTWTANVWANFYNTYNWGTCNGGVGMRMYMNGAGNWWQWSFNFGC
jgi:hypothetical protein